MAHTSADIIGEDFCKALKLEAGNIRRLDIILEAGCASQVNIERFITKKETGEITKILKKYELVESKK